MARTLEDHLGATERALWAGLNSPARIQAFLDDIPYSPEDKNRCPLSVLREHRAHCLDGALFGAAALRRLGYPPLIVDLLPEPKRDDDHLLALYRRNGCWGAVAKSNFSGLRAREPVYRSLRELVMSYFENFFNSAGERTLRAYSRPLNLATMDRYDWEWQDAGADAVEKRLYTLVPRPLLTPQMVAKLTPMDSLSYQAGTLGTNPEGLYKLQA
jgi:hypothetical protein